MKHVEEFVRGVILPIVVALLFAAVLSIAVAAILIKIVPLLN